MSIFRKNNLRLNGFLKKPAAQLEQNHSTHSAAMSFMIFVQSVLPGFSRKSIPFMQYPG